MELKTETDIDDVIESPPDDNPGTGIFHFILFLMYSMWLKVSNQGPNLQKILRLRFS